MHAAHACLVPVNYFITSLFSYLQKDGKPPSYLQAADFRHFLLILPFALDNLFKEEVEKYNRGRAQGRPALVDPSEELELV